jgi:uncharacterized protein (UPF0548 family)
VTGSPDRDLARALAGLPLTYPEQGGTAWEEFPAGYHGLERSVTLGSGADVFERAAAALLSWQMHTRAGLQIAGNAPTAVPGSCVLLIVGWPPLALSAPCRVVYDVAERRRRGFAYGTLPGHPECGEESFVVTHQDDDQVTFTVRAFSRHGTALAWIGGPFTRLAQNLATGHYLRTLRSIARE